MSVQFLTRVNLKKKLRKNLEMMIQRLKLKFTKFVKYFVNLLFSYIRQLICFLLPPSLGQEGSIIILSNRVGNCCHPKLLDKASSFYLI
ncbi:hypothetical protein GG496_002282 [Candidatus Fervidibacteria bacterium JGI MDM2 JNZ-1-D12]